MADRKESDDFSLVPTRIYPVNTADKEELPLQLKTAMTTDREVPGDIYMNQLPGIVDEVEAKLTFHGDEGEVHKDAVNSWTWPAIGVKEDSPFGNIHHGTGANLSRMTDICADSIIPDDSAKSLNITDNQDVQTGNLDVDDLCSRLVSGREGRKDPCRKRGLGNSTDSALGLEPKKLKHGSKTTEDRIHVGEVETSRPQSMVGLLQTQRFSVTKEDGQDNDATSTVSFSLVNDQGKTQMQNIIDDGSESMRQESRPDSEDNENCACKYEPIKATCIQNSLQEETRMDLTRAEGTDRPVAANERENLDTEVSVGMSDKINMTGIQEGETANSSGKQAESCTAKSASNTTQDECVSGGFHLPCGIKVDPCNCDHNVINDTTGRKSPSQPKEGDYRVIIGAAGIHDADKRYEDNSTAVVPAKPERAGHIHDENDGPTADEDDMFVSCDEDAEADLASRDSHCLQVNDHEKDITGKGEKVKKTDVLITNNSNFSDSAISEGLVDKASGKVLYKDMTNTENAEDNYGLKEFPCDNGIERSLTATERYFFKMLVGHSIRNTAGFQEEKEVNPGVISSAQANFPDDCLLNGEIERDCLSLNHNEMVVDHGINSSSEKVSNIIDHLLSMVIEEVFVKDSEDMETNCQDSSTSVTPNEKRSDVRATVYPSEACVKSPRLHVQVMEQIDELPEVEEPKSCVCHKTKRKGRWECVCTTDDDTDSSMYDGEISTPLEMLPTPNCSQPGSSVYSKVEHLLCCMESLPFDETEDEDDIPMLTVDHSSVSPLEEFSCSPEYTPLHKHSIGQVGPSDELRPNWTGVKRQLWDSPSGEESERKVTEEINSIVTSPIHGEQSCRMSMDYQLIANVRESDQKSTNAKSQGNQVVTDNSLEQDCVARPELEKKTTTSTSSHCSSESSIDKVDEAVFRSSLSYTPLLSTDHKKHFQVNGVQVAAFNNNENLSVDSSSASGFHDGDREAYTFDESIGKVKCIVKRASSQSGMPNEETVPSSDNVNCDSHSKLSLEHNKGSHETKTFAPEDDKVTAEEGMSVTEHCDGSLGESNHKCQQEQSIASDIATENSTCMSLAVHSYSTSSCKGQGSHSDDSVHVCSGEIPSNGFAVHEGVDKDMNTNGNDFQMTNHLPSKDTRKSDGDVSTASTNITETTSERENLPDITTMFTHENATEKGAVCVAVTPVSHETPSEYHVEPKERSSCDVMDQTVPDEDAEPLHNRDHTVEGVLGTQSDTGTLYAETSQCHDGKSSGLFYWSHQRISYTEQLVPTKADMSVKDSSSCGVLGVSPLKTCSRPIRVGLSRKQRVQKLHPYNKPNE